jgi:hypothetical protein
MFPAEAKKKRKMIHNIILATKNIVIWLGCQQRLGKSVEKIE